MDAESLWNFCEHGGQREKGRRQDREIRLGREVEARSRRAL